jgi:hypothetical protein
LSYGIPLTLTHTYCSSAFAPTDPFYVSICTLAFVDLIFKGLNLAQSLISCTLGNLTVN